MITELRDLVDVYISGLHFEIARDLRIEFGTNTVSNATIGEKVEACVIATMEHECVLEPSNLMEYAKLNKTLNKWYETNPNRYSDHFLEVLPIREPYVNDPEKYANIWGNLASQMIGAIVGNIREDGF